MANKSPYKHFQFAHGMEYDVSRPSFAGLLITYDLLIKTVDASRSGVSSVALNQAVILVTEMVCFPPPLVHRFCPSSSCPRVFSYPPGIAFIFAMREFSPSQSMTLFVVALLSDETGKVVAKYYVTVNKKWFLLR